MFCPHELIHTRVDVFKMCNLAKCKCEGSHFSVQKESFWCVLVIVCFNGSRRCDCLQLLKTKEDFSFLLIHEVTVIYSWMTCLKWKKGSVCCFPCWVTHGFKKTWVNSRLTLAAWENNPVRPPDCHSYLLSSLCLYVRPPVREDSWLAECGCISVYM